MKGQRFALPFFFINSESWKMNGERSKKINLETSKTFFLQTGKGL